MDRIIKFRGYDTELEEMTYFDSDDYILQYGDILREHIDDYDDLGNPEFDYESVKDKVELMQFTGLYDKDGKEIYEGDIVKFNLKSDSQGQPDIIGYIEYQTTFCAYRIMSFKGSFALDYNIKDIEVIGNIFDNKNILEEE